MKILVVDDNKTNRHLLKAILETEKMKVYEATDGLEALKILERDKINLVISDILLPNMDGYRLCFSMRRNERFKSIPFIAYTSTYFSEKDKEFAFRCGADLFLLRSIPQAELLAHIRRLTKEPLVKREVYGELPQEMEVFRVYSDVLIKKLERMNTELKESEARYRLVVNATTDVVWDWDLAENKMWWSEGMLALLGYTAKQVLPEVGWWKEKIHPEDRERVTSGIHRTIKEGGRLWSDEYRFQRADGSYAYVFDRGYITHDEKAKPVRMVGAIVDITVRKQMELKLQASESSLKEAQRIGKMGSWKWNVTTGQVNWTDEMFEIYDIPHTVNPTHELFLSVVHPDDKEMIKKSLREAFETGARSFSAEFRVLCRDHEVRHVFSMAKVIQGTNEHTIEVVGITQDITQRKKAEKRLRETEERFRIIFENAADGMVMADLKTKQLFFGNKMIHQMLGCGEEELERLGVGDIHPKEAVPFVLEQFERLVRKEISVTKDIPVKRRDGSVFYADISASQVSFRGVEYLLGIFRDITDRRKAETELIRLNSLLSSTIDSTSDGILVVDRQGRIALFNRRFVDMWGIPESVIATHDDKQALDFVVRQLKDPDGFLRKVHELYSAPEQESYDRIEFKDGRIFGRYSRPQKKDQEIIGRVWSFHDMVECRKE